MDNLLNFIGVVFYMAAPVMFAALGGMISERAGVVNIALEGLMCVGAFIAATMQFYLYPITGGYSWIFGMLIAGVLGGLASFILSFSLVKMKGESTIAGFGMNTLMLGTTLYLTKIIFGTNQTSTFQLGMPKDPILGLYPTVYLMFIAVILVNFFLFKKRVGLRVRAAGEKPEGVATAGLDVHKLRIGAVAFSGVMAGFAGAALVLTETTQYNAGTINGRGFIAISAIALGRWKPIGVMGAALLFGGATAISVYSSSIKVLEGIPSELFNMAPYVITLIALVVVSGKDIAPKALGKPY